MQLYKLTCLLLQSRKVESERSLIAFCFLIPNCFLNSKSEIYIATALCDLGDRLLLDKLHCKDHMCIVVYLDYELDRFDVDLD